MIQAGQGLQHFLFVNISLSLVRLRLRLRLGVGYSPDPIDSRKEHFLGKFRKHHGHRGKLIRVWWAWGRVRLGLCLVCESERLWDHLVAALRARIR
eukprot:1214733-Amorphochlora_amoeboformis.AAC.1